MQNKTTQHKHKINNMLLEKAIRLLKTKKKKQKKKYYIIIMIKKYDYVSSLSNIHSDWS